VGFGPCGTPFAPPAETHITPDQAKELFALVDELIKFSSHETGLPIKSDVKRRSPAAREVEATSKKNSTRTKAPSACSATKSSSRSSASSITTSISSPFCSRCSTEQVEAYYDSKTKTVNMLDWVDIDEQKPVLAHELTHALQDQHVDLDKWDDQTPDDVSSTPPTTPITWPKTSSTPRATPWSRARPPPS
jgi:hypothetical protein